MKLFNSHFDVHSEIWAKKLDSILSLGLTLTLNHADIMINKINDFGQKLVSV